MDIEHCYATLPVSDLERARTFYSEKLALKIADENPGGIFYEMGSTQIFVFKSTGQASGAHTQAGVRVPDIESAVAELKERGVSFEDYENLTVGSIADTGPVRAAWFKDPDGNLIGLTQLKT